MAGVLPWMSGCGNSSEYPVGAITGRVTYEGQPVQQGLVTFYSSELGEGISEEIKEDGRYATQTPLRTGSYVVTVLPPDEPPPTEDTPVATIAPVKDIPEKYRDPKKSGLTIVVKEGENTFDIAMTK